VAGRDGATQTRAGKAPAGCTSDQSTTFISVRLKNRVAVCSGVADMRPRCTAGMVYYGLLLPEIFVIQITAANPTAESQVLPINYLIHQRKLLYWNKLFTSDNCVLLFFPRLVSQRFVAIGNLYGLSSIHTNQQTLKRAVLETFASTVE